MSLFPLTGRPRSRRRVGAGTPVEALEGRVLLHGGGIDPTADKDLPEDAKMPPPTLAEYYGSKKSSPTLTEFYGSKSSPVYLNRYGELHVNGSSRDDVIKIRMNWIDPTKIEVVLGEAKYNKNGDFTGTDSVFQGTNLPKFDQTAVKQIVVHTGDGINRVLNSTHVPAWIYGGNDEDILVGGGAGDGIWGGGGNDKLFGRGGADNIFGGPGEDLIVGDWYSTMGIIKDFNESFGDESSSVDFGTPGADWIEGGENDDRIFGNGGSDDLFGDQGDDQLEGGTGNDDIYGGAGDDLLNGNAGNDDLFGGSGADRLFGDQGNDDLDGGTSDGDPDRLLVWGLQDDFGIITGDTTANVGSEDAVIQFADGTNWEDLWGETYKSGAWTAEQILDIDSYFQVMVDETGTTKLLKTSAGKTMTIARFGESSKDASWNSSQHDFIAMVQETFEAFSPEHFPSSSSPSATAASVNDLWWKQSLIHEIGHFWDTPEENSMVTEFREVSGWVQAQFWEKSKTKGKVFAPDAYGEPWWYDPASEFLGEYAKRAPQEDFAESFAAYWIRKIDAVDPAEVYFIATIDNPKVIDANLTNPLADDQVKWVTVAELELAIPTKLDLIDAWIHE